MACKTSRKRLYHLKSLDYTPDVETCIDILECLGAGDDPVSVKRNDGNWFELDHGFRDYESGVECVVGKSHDCPYCDCNTTINLTGLGSEFQIKYFAIEGTAVGMVEGTLYEMVLDRMGISKSKKGK